MDDPSRLARLNAIKLAALVREHLGDDHPGGMVPSDFPGGAALMLDGDAWVLLADRPSRALGHALAWALRQGAARLHLVAEEGTGTLARRAAGFTLPISVWHAEGRTLLPAVAEPLPEPSPVPEAHRPWETVIAAAGAEPHEEFGVLSGEVAGLEVCRVVDDPFTDAVRLEVGVGAHDREAFQMLHGDRPTEQALAEVVRAVLEHRLHDTTGHPLSRLAQERLLRRRVIAQPDLIGASIATMVPPPVPRPNLKDPVPCVALATVAGAPTVVVCTTGVDLDAIPYVVDARLALGIVPCIVAMPRRDALEVQRLLAETLDPPAFIVPVD